MGEKPSKKVLDALERVFSAEISDRLPFQSKAKIYRDLCEDGLLEPMERTFGTGVFRVVVKGYALTHAGRYFYGTHCEDDDAPNP